MLKTYPHFQQLLKAGIPDEYRGNDNYNVIVISIK